MSNCVEEYKETIIGASIGFGFSLLMNLYLAIKIYCIPKKHITENRKIREVEMTVKENKEEKEEVVLRIGTARNPIIRNNNLPEWVIEDYNNNLRVPTIIAPESALLTKKSGSI
jgi:hypothetical protein